MTNLSKKLEQIVNNSLIKNPIVPVKTDQGILVGNVLIVSIGPLKNLYRYDKLFYSNIHLNVAAIRIANLLAKNNDRISAEKIYTADQEYGRWLIDSQMLRTQHEKAISTQDYDRADILWAKYCESRDRTSIAKNQVEALATS
jgi:hypothetical protein